MADLIKQHFRATNGLDAAGEKIINVAKADYAVLDDGVNVEFFIEQNTIQEYDPTRGYNKGFAVTYNGRIWISSAVIAAPSGAFTQSKWSTLRTDPKWEYINSQGKQLLSGDFISADTSASDLTFTLPSNPQDGDTIAIGDVGGNSGYGSILVNASNQRIAYSGSQLTSLRLTHPYSITYFIFSNRLWQTFILDHESRAKVINNSNPYKAQASDTLYMAFPTSGPLKITLPKYMNSGDVIHLYDIDGKAPQNHFIVSSFDSTSSIGSIGTTTQEYRSSGNCSFVFDATDRLWRRCNGDLRARLRIIRDDVTLVPNESVMVFGSNNSTIKTINIKLPTDIQNGDNVTIALNYMRKGQTVVIKAANGDTIASNKTMMQFPRRSEYPPEDAWVQNSSITFNGDSDYVPIIQLSYIEDLSTSTKYWVVSDISPRVERVDPTNPSRLGVIALATQAQANTDKSGSPANDLAVTPATLANRTSTETRQGIAAIATSSQVNQDTTSTFDDSTIVTPKKLNERTATETRRGVAEIATQQEVDSGTDDSTIVTPKKLDAHRATESMAGVAKIVSSGGTRPTVRGNSGTGIFNTSDNSTIVTPKAVKEIYASQTVQGTVFLATEVEVIQGPTDIATTPLAVTPGLLHKKTATETRIGFTQTATQNEVTTGTDDFKYVTPLKFASRKSTETLDGIIRVGTQTEFNNGALDNVVSTPLKVKTFLSGNRTSVNEASGLTQSGNIWSGLALDIKAASDTQRGTVRKATSDEVDQGENDDTFVTPKRLQLKKATETTEGSIRFATISEVELGKEDKLAVSAKNLKIVMQDVTSWEASPTLRGPIRISSGSTTFIGDNVSGNTQNIESYVKSGFAISPYELNKTLANYMPLKATAVNSSALGGITATNYMRKDIEQTIPSTVNFTGIVNTADINSSSTGTFNKVVAKQSVVVGPSGTNSGDATLEINGNSNPWRFYAGDNLGKLGLFTAGSSSEIVTIDNTGGMYLKSFVKSFSMYASTKFVLNNKDIMTFSGNVYTYGTTAIQTALQSNDASTLEITDPSGTYPILNKKNFVSQVSSDFVRKNAPDTVTGNLTFTKPTRQLIDSQISAAFISNTEGNFSVDVSSSSVYNTLPGYAVAVNSLNLAGQDTGIAASYNYVKGPGTLTQHGASSTGKYQIWAPRPLVVTAGNNAQTFWIRNYNTAKGAWDDWTRMYTSGNPPTAAEIGAVSVNDSTFDNVKVRDWLQIGNVRIRPDNDLRTVVFEWIDS